MKAAAMTKRAARRGVTSWTQHCSIKINTNYERAMVAMCVYANAPSRLAPEPGPGIHAFDGFQVFIHVPLGATRGASGANERFALRCERG